MNNIIKRVWNQNRMVNIEDLSGMAFQAEDGGHTFEISGVNDAGESVPLSGTVAGVFMRPDGTDVALTGTASDGVASVTLSDACYAVAGRFGLYIFVTSDSKKTCVYACIGTVAQTSSGTVAGDTPQDVVDLINAINAAIASIPADYTDLLDSIAPSFSDSTAYTTGTIVWYNGLLYQFTADKAAGSWDATKVRQIALADDVDELKIAINLINEALEIINEDVTVIDGYSTNNTGSTTSSNSPFIYGNQTSYDFTDCVVTKIKLNVKTAGTVSIGVVKRSYVELNQSFDRNNLVTKETITFTQTGVQEAYLATPFAVASDEYLFIGNNTDTAVWAYGNYGTDTRFFYIQSNVVKSSSSSVGVSVTCRKEYVTPIAELIDSIYNGKTLSILGDSISTYSGYIPEGNATYYPSGTVQAVSDTWWYKLYAALGMTLNVNNSWSGSRVTGSDASAGCGDRAEALGTNPDVIIVWMGINDFNNEVALGTYDGTTALPSTTSTFREAYAIMLNKILTKYQSSEVWVCTLPQCERNAESGFPEINGNGVALAEFNKAILELANAFGVKVLDHNKCGLTYQNMPTFNPDNLHPNKYGHSLVANNDIRQMDNLVRTRYPIA